MNDGYYDDAVKKLRDHDPNSNLRGGKYSLMEAGTRIPFITYCKGAIQPGTSNAIVCQIGLLASFEALAHAERSETDSQYVVTDLLGKNEHGRDNLIFEASGKNMHRGNDWLLIAPYKFPIINKNENIETGGSPEYQLYPLKNDLVQKNNMAQSEIKKQNELYNSPYL